ncbi:hypothetical protein Tcan_16376 [Toxocara canis]|uniref:BOD1/SHG1 domain-containing protein n=1 Tax=Toxocara canis TaxID=6265 RepID=A0A0B2USA3_TOXCA|nr:hypothetical protein Tcan_16376 [Toxocara canis]
MSLSTEDQKGIEQLVDKYKKDGRFDEVRRKHFASITADGKFSKLSAEAERLVDDILANRPAYFTKNQVREKLLDELNSRFRKQCESIVFQHTGTDESIMTLLADIRPRVESFLGLSGDEALDEVQHMEENHQVCDMDIESESEQGVSSVDNGQQQHALSDIQLPPPTKLPPCNYAQASPTSSITSEPIWNPNLSISSTSGQFHLNAHLRCERNFALNPVVYSPSRPPRIAPSSGTPSQRF